MNDDWKVAVVESHTDTVWSKPMKQWMPVGSLVIIREVPATLYLVGYFDVWDGWGDDPKNHCWSFYPKEIQQDFTILGDL